MIICIHADRIGWRSKDANLRISPLNATDIEPSELKERKDITTPDNRDVLLLKYKNGLSLVTVMQNSLSDLIQMPIIKANP